MKKLITTVALAFSTMCTFAQVPTNGLVAYYPFNGNANDVSGNGNNGVAQNITFTEGAIGQSANFDGTGMIDVPSSSMQGLLNFSISYWLKVKSTSGRQVIGSLWSPDNIIFDFNQTPNKLMSQIAHSSGRSDITNSNVSELNTWYYCVHVQNASTSRHEFYVNGILIASNSITPKSISTNNPFQLGHYNGSLKLNGQLDEFRIYNRVLTANELAQLNCQPNATTSTTTQSTCTSYAWNGTTYTSSGTYTKTGLKNKAGCDSTATLNLTILKASTSTSILTACVSYTWNGTTYTQSGTYTKTGLKNKAGCDSTATLNLTIKQPSTSTTTQSVCTSYTWNGTTYTASGTYTKTGLKNKAGCDSTATLNLTINPLITVSFSLPSSISNKANAINLTGTPTGGTFSGKGVANNVLNPANGGLGTRAITYNYTDTKGCANALTKKVLVLDTIGTACATYDTLYIKTSVVTGTNSTVLENTLKIYPNPASDYLIIENGNFGIMAGYSVQVLNAQGQTVFSSAINQAQFNINLSNWAKSSLYVVKLFNAQNAVIETKKVVLQ